MSCVLTFHSFDYWGRKESHVQWPLGELQGALVYTAMRATMVLQSLVGRVDLRLRCWLPAPRRSSAPCGRCTVLGVAQRPNALMFFSLRPACNASYRV